MPFTIYADLECLLEKMSTCQINNNKLFLINHLLLK